MFYIFVRFFPKFTSSFPIDRFKDLPEDEIETALRAAVDAGGPSDAAMIEQMNSARNEALKRSPARAAPSRHIALAITPAIREYRQKRDALRTPTNVASLELLLNKLAEMKWIPRPCAWNWDFLKQHVLESVDTEEVARKVLAELSPLFSSRQQLQEYGIPGVLAFGIVEEASLSAGVQVAWNRDLRKRKATFDDPNDRSTLMQMCRETVELVGRLSPQLNGDPVPSQMDANEKQSEPPYEPASAKSKLNDTDKMGASFIRKNPGCKGDAVAVGISITPEHFRSRVFPKLRAIGFYNDGDGYRPPKQKNPSAK